MLYYKNDCIKFIKNKQGDTFLKGKMVPYLFPFEREKLVANA